MIITKENLIEFEKQYEIIHKAAEKLFDSIEIMEHQYKTGYRETYSFDGFEIECGYITLKGSYSYVGGGDITYDISLEDFANPESYLANREEEHLKKRREREAKAAEVQKLKEKQEYEQFMKLKAKFEDK